VADSTTRSPAKKTGKKTSTKKSPAKRSSAKKTSTKKSPAQKSSTADKATTKKTDGQDPSAQDPSGQNPNAEKSSSKRTAPRAAPPRSGGNGRNRGSAGRGTRVAGAAREAVLDLTGKQAEAVTGLERTDEGWSVEVEVLELSRIPNTTDVLATYQVTVDDDGELQGCRRVRRYVRGSPGDD
jgi:hypothetical protein